MIYFNISYNYIDMANAWIQHVKQYARDNNVKYNIAIKEARASYKPQGKGLKRVGHGLKRAGEGLSRPGESPYKPRVKHRGQGLVRVGSGLTQAGGEMDGDGVKEVYDNVMNVIKNNPILKVAMEEGRKALGKLNKQTGSGVSPQISPKRVKQALAEITNTINKINEKVQEAPENQSGSGQSGGFYGLLASIIPALSSLASTMGPIVASALAGVAIDKIIGKGQEEQDGGNFIEDVLQVGSYFAPGVNLAMAGVAKNMRGNGARGNISTTVGQKKPIPMNINAMNEQLARL